MFDKWLRLPAHLYLRITALTLLTVGIALSNVLMSIGAIWIISNWLIEANFNSYWQKFKEKKTVWIVVAIYVFIAISLLWSNDAAYGFKDLRVKLPFIVIPLVLATSEPLQKKHFYFLLYVFLGVVLYTSVYNYIRYNYVLENVHDIREMSVFISHVRLSVLINFAIFTCIFLIYKKKFKPLVWIILLGWYAFYLYKSQIINGYILFLALSIFALFFFVFRMKSKKLKFTVLALAVLGGISVSILGYNTVQKLNTCEHVPFSELDLYTVNGNPYYHDTLNTQSENGSFVWLYLSNDELSQEWEKRSAIPYDSLDNKGQPMYGTLMRFLTSKHLRKDSVGLAELTDDEIQRIENGQTGVLMNQGLITRLNAFLMEYRIYSEGGDPNGHSLIQRIEHLKAAVGIIKNHWVVGVGAGDVPTAFTDQYAQMNSRLIEEHQHRSHNQFLTIWVGLGIVGFILFLLLLIWPFFELESKDYFMGMVLLSLIISCFFQDFIETQAGVTIFALFYSLALYREKEEV
ncbi:MAG: hypothetical protein GQ574_24450 [Crocinitomix sp.]|nr:hypothetical protein [Crocinitomix sp.]